MIWRNVLVFLASGIVYAGIMAGFDYADGELFQLKRFIFNALSFGTAMTLYIIFQGKKKKKE